MIIIGFLAGVIFARGIATLIGKYCERNDETVEESDNETSDETVEESDNETSDKTVEESDKTSDETVVDNIT